MKQTLTNSKTPVSWPFKYFNGEQTPESKELEMSKFKKTSSKDIIAGLVNDTEEALF